jgi:hypothetical protein
MATVYFSLSVLILILVYLNIPLILNDTIWWPMDVELVTEYLTVLYCIVLYCIVFIYLAFKTSMRRIQNIVNIQHTDNNKYIKFKVLNKIIKIKLKI